MDKTHDAEMTDVTLFANANRDLVEKAIRGMFQNMVEVRPYGGTRIGFGATLNVDRDRKTP